MNLIKHPLLPVALVLGPLLVLVFASYPMMYPGFDVWIHMARMAYGEPGVKVWYDVWRGVFALLQIDNVFDRALLIHRVQVLLTVGMVGLSAYWVLLTVFQRTAVKRTTLALQALCAVWIWLIMHGTVSRPVGGDQHFWQSWLLWYSVNYQIALPVYFMSTAALLLAWLGDVSRQARYGLLAVAFVGSVFIAKVHAGELPYLIFSAFLLLLLAFKRQLVRRYLALIFFGVVATTAAIGLIGRLPTGLQVFKEKGFEGFASAALAYGDLMVAWLNRGGASWNFYYFMGFAAAVLALVLARQKDQVQFRPLWFLLLSSIPAMAIHAPLTAGLLAMVTYPEIAWRFSFSSFLFVAVPVLSVMVGLRFTEFMGSWRQLVLTGTLCVATLMASYVAEPNNVAYRYTRSLLTTLSTERVHFGLPPQSEGWLEQVNQALIAEKDQGPVCADMFSAYYLYFVYQQKRMILPTNVEVHVGKCDFPRDGGDLKRLGLSAAPWKF
jgi:hypothetical protein